MGKNLRQAMVNANIVSEDAIKNDKDVHPENANSANGVKPWSEVLLFAMKDGFPVRVTSMSERATVLRYYRDNGAFPPGYSPFNRRIVPELNPSIFDALKGVNEDGSDVDYNALSDGEKAERDEALKIAQDIFADSDDTFSYSNLPVYERGGEGKFHRVSDHRICALIAWQFIRFGRFFSPGEGGTLGISPWPFTVDYTGIEAATSGGSSRSSGLLANLIKHAGKSAPISPKKK